MTEHAQGVVVATVVVVQHLDLALLRVNHWGERHVENLELLEVLGVDGHAVLDLRQDRQVVRQRNAVLLANRLDGDDVLLGDGLVREHALKEDSVKQVKHVLRRRLYASRPATNETLRHTGGHLTAVPTRTRHSTRYTKKEREPDDLGANSTDHSHSERLPSRMAQGHGRTVTDCVPAKALSRILT